MAKIFSQVKFTAAERRAIDAGWMALEDIADRTGSTGADYLRKALRMETTGPQSVPVLFAKGMLCGWFLSHGNATVASLYGTREASILVTILLHVAKQHRTPPTDAEVAKLTAAFEAKGAAFERRER